MTQAHVLAVEAGESTLAERPSQLPRIVLILMADAILADHRQMLDAAIRQLSPDDPAI